MSRETFEDALRDRGWVQAGTRGEFRRGPANLFLAFTSFRAEVRFLGVDAAARGGGEAKAALSDLTACADAAGLILLLRVEPVGSGGLSADALVALYGRFGFREIGRGPDGEPVMSRRPESPDDPKPF